jgi:hypothetical protein
MILCKHKSAMSIMAILGLSTSLGGHAALPDWSNAGYLQGSGLPTSSDYTSNPTCRITAQEMENTYGVIGNDNQDDTAGIQAAIDFVKSNCQGSYTNLSTLSLPSGEINISKQIGVDANFLIIQGQGNDPSSSSSTQVVFAPDVDTRYDNISDFDLNDMLGEGSAKGGWIWPGRGAFRVQSRAVHSSYQTSHANAPANRRDFYEGSVNFHWKNEDITANANAGDTVITLKNVNDYSVGGYVWVGSANTDNFYQEQGVLETNRINSHMRQQIHQIVAVNGSTKQVTLDKPLEFPIYTTNTGDGSVAIKGSTYKSRAANLQVIEGVGFENFYLTQVAPAGFTAQDAKNNYNNIDHHGAMHGLVFKWVVNSYVKGVRTYMVGSHPIVTEMAKNLQFENNQLEGSWNKGKGGNGYFRNSKLWDSVIKNNVTRDVRHITLQWSASGNVVTGNDTDADLNLHGGWERFNLIENNTVNVPYAHRDCNPNCAPGSETWYPIWYAPGEHAGRWSGSSGPRNVFYRNTLTKQLTQGGPFVDFGPYGTQPDRLFQFAWDTLTAQGTQWRHLQENGANIPFWTGRETLDYTQNNRGINANCTATAASLVGATITCNGEVDTGNDDDPIDDDDVVDDEEIDDDVVDECVAYTGGRQDLNLNAARCVSIPQGLAGNSVQVWNNKPGTGCGFKGDISGSDSGTFSLTATYTSASGLVGERLVFAEGNSCTKIRVRVY